MECGVSAATLELSSAEVTILDGRRGARRARGRSPRSSPRGSRARAAPTARERRGIVRPLCRSWAWGRDLLRLAWWPSRRPPTRQRRARRFPRGCASEFSLSEASRRVVEPRRCLHRGVALRREGSLLRGLDEIVARKPCEEAQREALEPPAHRGSRLVAEGSGASPRRAFRFSITAVSSSVALTAMLRATPSAALAAAVHAAVPALAKRTSAAARDWRTITASAPQPSRA